MSHHAFSLANPNRVRSLIGGFSANATQFNRADGAGYDLLAEIVLTLDGPNPQIAARLLTAMRSWRSLEPERREKAQRRAEAHRRQARRSRPMSATSSRAALPEALSKPRSARCGAPHASLQRDEAGAFVKPNLSNQPKIKVWTKIPARILMPVIGASGGSPERVLVEFGG